MRHALAIAFWTLAWAVVAAGVVFAATGQVSAFVAEITRAIQ